MTRLIQICVVLLVCVFVHGDIPDHTCFTADPIRKLDGTNDNALIGSYVGYVENDVDLTTTFGRVVDTGSGDQLNPGSKGIKYQHYADKRSAVRQYLSVTSGNHRVGAFFCNSKHLEDDPSYIPLIILAIEAYVKPEKRTQTVSFGETVTINMNLSNGHVTDLRWRLKETIMESWSGMANVTIEHVTKDDAGIYECYLNNTRNEGKHAIMRLIVRGCSAARWGPDCQNLCPTCYNGGVCDDVTGLCICPPGFNTTDCSFGCGNNRWGRNCSIVCSIRNPGCRGNLACVPDPLGCSCMAGYGGLNCKKGCEEMGKYGSTCSEECHCADNVTCDPSIGCPNGPCADGYSGKNCQVPDTCPDGRYGELCKYYCHCEDDGPCNRTTGSCGERKCRQLWIGNDCQLDGKTNIRLLDPNINIGAPVSITCIVQANPIPNDEDVQVLYNNDTRLEGGVSTVTEFNYTRTVMYSVENVAEGDFFKCQVFSSVAGDAHIKKHVTIYDPPVLTTPPQVTASNTTVTVTWDQWTGSDGNGDGPVIGYQVCYLVINSSLICNKSVLNLTASFVIDSNDEIQRGLEYFFIVRAIRPGYLGEGRFTQPTSFTIPCLSPEVAPTNVDGLSLGFSEIQVQWQLIDAEHWRCNSLDDYEVEYKKSGSHIFLNVTSTDTSVTISNLEPCTNYEIKVRATNSGGDGPSTEIVMVTTDAQEPDSVKDARITAASSRSLLVTWGAPDIHGCEIDFYKVEYQLQNPGMCGENLGNVEGPLNTTSTSIEIDNLEAYSQYSITICPVIGEMGGTDNLEGPETTVNGSTVEEKPTGKPLAVLNQVHQQTELSFTWQPPECGKRSGPLTKYKSRLKNSTSTDTKEMSELSVAFSSLLPCTEYTFQVRAANGELFGPWSDVLHVQTASQEPDSVKDVVITAASSRSLLVLWEAPDIHGCEIDFYKLEYHLKNPGMCGENLGSVEGPLYTNSTSIEIPNLEVYSQYSVRIRAVIGQMGGTDNLEGPETTLSGRTDEAEPVAGPWGVQTLVSQEATNDTRGEIEIIFGSVPCLKKRGEILNYRVQVIDGVGNENTVTVDASPATITGGFPCESVIPQVAACTSAGCGVFASGPIIKMNIAAPGKVSVDVKSQPLEPSKLHISWSQPEVVHCPIAKYKIEYRLTHLDQCQEQNNKFEEFQVVDNTETQDFLTGLKPFSTYEIVVSAGVDGMNGNTIFTSGQTGFANTTSKVPERGPKEVNATAVSATRATFVWSEIECGYRNGHIRGYKFSLQNADSQELIKSIYETTDFQCKVENLKPYTKYIFSVRGFNSEGDSKIYKELSIMMEESIPSVVRNIEIINADTKSFRIKWSRPEPPNGIIIRYQINYTVTDRFENKTWSVQYNVSDEERDTIDFNFIIGNLQPYTNYFVQAAASTSVGIGPWSDELNVFTITSIPESVENIFIQETTLVWDRPPPLTSDILKYHIHANLVEKDQCQQVDRNKTFTVEDAEVNLLTFEPYSTYRVTISAETDAGLGPETTHKFVTPQKVPESGPKEVNVTAVSATRATFAWSDIECGYRRGLIRGYKFSLQNADGQELITNSVTSELQCEIVSLKPITEYIFSIKGFNSKGDGKSKELRVTTDKSNSIILIRARR